MTVSLRVVIVLLVITALVLFFNWDEIRFGKSAYINRMIQKLFPVRMNDIQVSDPIADDENYSKVLGLCHRVPTHSEMVYLLKYKKFVDRQDVYSMADTNEIDQMYELIGNIVSNKTPGCIVETGCWRGGMGCFIKAVLKDRDDNRKLYLFDTFTHFPKPATRSNSKDETIHSIVELLFENMQSVEQVKNNFRKFGLLDANVHFKKGLFADTVPRTDPGPIAILRLDSDYYESTMFVLEWYYNKIVPGGYLVIDDYNNHFLGCKDAVDEFRLKHNITNEIVDPNGGSVYWQV